MNKPTSPIEWARAAVALVLKNCTERAARRMETKAHELRLSAARMREARR
jgi:hypothetical protein